MNAQVFKALFLDALAQVLDNRVFRILCILVAIPILFTFVVGIREDELVLLFGYREYYWDELPVFLAEFFRGGKDAQIQNIQNIQGLFIDQLAGKAGVFICVAATAFFVPRMTEKGSADTLFSKPVSRGALYLSRYVAGLLFVAILSAVLVLGMHLGFMLNSGYNDPGFLWGAVTITYLFGLIHGVTMLIGVVTRSTVAAILLAMMFFVLNGCVHLAWEVKEYSVDFAQRRAGLLEHVEPGQEDAGNGGEEPHRVEVETHEGPDWLYWVLRNGIDCMHYPLPKTNDARRITAALRRAVETGATTLDDPATLFRLGALPDGFEVVEKREFQDPELSEPDDAETIVTLLRALDADGNRIEVSRRRRGQYEIGSGPKGTRYRQETVPHVIDAMADELRADPAVLDVEDSFGGLGGRQAQILTWTRTGPDGPRHLERAVVQRQINRDDGHWYLMLEVETGGEAAPVRGRSLTLQAVQDQSEFVPPEQADNPFAWYETRLGWDAPLRFNYAFSIGSSLAFTVVMLLLGWWKLRRIDF